VHHQIYAPGRPIFLVTDFQEDRDTGLLADHNAIPLANPKDGLVAMAMRIRLEQPVRKSFITLPRASTEVFALKIA
jgi:hypothetical protein